MVCLSMDAGPSGSVLTGSVLVIVVPKTVPMWRGWGAWRMYRALIVARLREELQ